MSNALSISDSSQPISASALATVNPSSHYEEFLRLQLVPKLAALLPTQQIGSVLTIGIGQIAPIPHTPAWVMGVYNWRGEILWMVDLGHLCGLTPWYQQAGNVAVHTAVVLQIQAHELASTRIKHHRLGLVVHQVEQIEACDTAMLQSFPALAETSAIAPFLRGYWWKSNDAMLAVLDGTAILEAMPTA